MNLPDRVWGCTKGTGFMLVRSAGAAQLAADEGWEIHEYVQSQPITAEADAFDRAARFLRAHRASLTGNGRRASVAAWEDAERALLSRANTMRALAEKTNGDTASRPQAVA